jgi:hypothetical protein
VNDKDHRGAFFQRSRLRWKGRNVCVCLQPCFFYDSNGGIRTRMDEYEGQAKVQYRYRERFHRAVREDGDNARLYRS